MKLKKYTITACLLASVLGGTTACNLDFEPESTVTYTGYWNKEEGVRAAYTALFDRFRAYGSTFFYTGEMRADIWGGSRMLEAPVDIQLLANQYSATTTFWTNWGNFYQMMHYLNDFITNAGAASFTREVDRSNMLAQAYGLRAFIYYRMLQVWGDVIITTEPVTGDKVGDLAALRRARSPKADVMAQVLADIEKSIELYNQAGVASTWSNSNVYWSKAATLTLKGDALLWKGQVLGGGSADFTAAKAALQEVVSMNKYSLVDYNALWSNEANAEFIFALDYQKDQATHFYSGNFYARAVDLNGKYTQLGEVFSATLNPNLVFSGGNHHAPSDYTLKMLYGTAGDKRSNTFALVFDATDATDATAQDLTTLTNTNNSKYRGAILRKFWGRTDAGSRLADNNIPIYRYADVLLLLAEAKNQLGEDPSGEINQVRTRAGLTTAYTNSTKLANKEAILEERLKEFVGEGKRWLDLVRAGDNLVFKYVTSISSAEAYRIYMPISTAMISADPELIKQTEGYN